jgi:hypothetical protein
MRAALLAVLLLVASAPCARADDAPVTPVTPTPAPTAPAAGEDEGIKLHIGEGARRSPRDDKSIFEVTIGTGQGFPAPLVGDYGDDTEIIATTSLIVLLEVFIQRWVRVTLYYDQVITPEIRSINGELTQDILPSRLLAGLMWVPFYIDFLKSARVEFQGITQLGLTLDDAPEVVPSVVGRVALMQDYAAGVTTYLGFFYHFNIDKVGFLYGVGYRF